MAGLYFAGRGKHYKPWFEVKTFGKTYPEIFARMYKLLPEGSHVSIYYSISEETCKEMLRGVPEPATKKGFILLQAGARWFKNWYFSEGFMEGGTKIQGDKVSGKGFRKEIRKQLKDLIKRGGPQESVERAKNALKFL
jgi:hypothetical protein